MSLRTGIVVFARSNSVRLPGKPLRPVGGMPLLERVIRRAQLVPLPVYLATTDQSADDALVTLAHDLGVRTYRGSADRVLDRAVLAAESFGLEVFVRLCGDRPLFPVDDLKRAVALHDSATSDECLRPDLVTTYQPGCTPRGLTTEVVRTASLRKVMEQGVSGHHQEHVTSYFYDHREQFAVVDIGGATVADFRCPGFAVDTEEDLRNLNRIFAVSGEIGLTPTDADRIYAE